MVLLAFWLLWVLGLVRVSVAVLGGYWLPVSSAVSRCRALPGAGLGVSGSRHAGMCALGIGAVKARTSASLGTLPFGFIGALRMLG